MFGYEPAATLAAIAAPVTALVSADDEGRSRAAALADMSAARTAAGRDPIQAVPFRHAGHNLMRYRPVEVCAAILSVAAPVVRPNP
jgi:pimeloyl-ACP methyl ester carboxylesterase